MGPKETIAIFDIGKTNKKLFLFDAQYNVLMERTEQFAEITDDDGDPCEDLQALSIWLGQCLEELHGTKGILIRALNFAAYGASFVHVGQQGHPVAPLYSYLKAYPDNLKEQFYNRYGGEAAFSLLTASPSLGSLNSGLQLYRLRHEKPELFSKIHYSLHLPQYLAYLVTGNACSDITSIGCHTGMWNFSRDQYHDWIYREGIAGKLAPILPSDRLMPASGSMAPIPAGTGLHDSSAALIPYVASFSEPFVLISTGTWCISLNPFNQEGLTVEQLQRDCLCYMEYRGRPIKASRLFAGHEHEVEVRKLAQRFDVAADHYRTVQPDKAIIMQLAALLNKGTGEHHPGHGLSSLAGKQNGKEYERSGAKGRDIVLPATYSEAYYRLMFDIIVQQVASTNLVMEGPPVKNIYVDGGFGKNPIYMQLLAAAYPRLSVYAASISQATALGAALAVHNCWNDGNIPAGIVELRRYMAPQLAEL